MTGPAVLHVVSSDQRRGAESVGVSLAEALVARGRTDRCVALSTHGPGGYALPVLGPSRYALSTLRALRAEARRSDVVVAHGSSTLLACAVALTATGRPWVYVNIGDPGYWAGSGFRRWRVSRMLHRAAVVAAISEGSAQTLRTDFGLAASAVTVIPNGRDPGHYGPATAAARAAARRRWHLDDRPVVVWVGSLSVEKRPDLALSVAADLPGVQLLVIGAGPLEGELARRAGDNVTFTGRLEDPRPAYAAADVLLLTSDSEGVPGVLIEAGLSGLPAVATDVGYVSEVVRDGVTGRLAPAGDAAALAAAVEDTLRVAPTLGAAALAHCRDRYALPQVVDRWEELTERLARRGRGA